MKVYVDTSVFGGCFDPEFEKWSNGFFKEVDKGLKTIVISALVNNEIEDAPEQVRSLFARYEFHAEKVLVTDEAVHLAEMYIKEKALTPRFFNDGLHIALATIHKIDVLVSWNFKHIVNLNRIRIFNSINLKNGYGLIEIRSPREILIEK